MGVVALLVLQTKCADVLVVNKMDLVDTTTSNNQNKELLWQVIAALNPGATRHATTYGKIGVDPILAVARNGVVLSGLVDDHREAIAAATVSSAKQVQVQQPDSTTTITKSTSATVDCAEPDCTDASHSHDHPLSNSADLACAEPDCTRIRNRFMPMEALIPLCIGRDVPFIRIGWCSFYDTCRLSGDLPTILLLLHPVV